MEVIKNFWKKKLFDLKKLKTLNLQSKCWQKNCPKYDYKKYLKNLDSLYVEY